MAGKIFKTWCLRVLLVISILLPCLIATPAVATSSYPYSPADSEVAKALNYLRGEQGTDGSIVGFPTSAWVVMAIAAAGEDPDSWKVGSNPSIVDYLATNAGSAAIVNDYSRMILAIAAAGEDPTSFGGIDFLSLLEAAYDGVQIGDTSLLNDDFWAVMALVAAGEDTSTSNAMLDSVAFILGNQNPDGGWSWGVGQDSDVDDTAAAIMALIAAGESAGSTPIVDGLAYIKSMQMDNGGFESWGSTNSATNSWGIASIVAAGQNPIDAAWQSGLGNDPVDDLLVFQNSNGSFNWTPSTPSNLSLMTSYAIVALLGTPYPVAVLPPQEPPDGVTIDVRIEGQNGTVWSGTVTVNDSDIVDDQGGQYYLAEPTALGALDEASQEGGFPYVVQNTAFGLYVYSINGEEPAGLAGWTYRVDFYSSMAGAADFILDQTSPPNPPHQEVCFAYSEWGQPPLKVEVNDTSPAVGETFTVTVSGYDDGTETWSPTAGAAVYANQNYTTGPGGTVNIAINSDLTVVVYADKDGYIRSNRVTVKVGAGSTQPGDNQNVSLMANIIPAISFSVHPSSINFGSLGPGDTSDPQDILISNHGTWDLRITATVTDTAQNLYVLGLRIDEVMWSVFSMLVDRNEAEECFATLTVPMSYTRTGLQNGTLIFWAEAAP